MGLNDGYPNWVYVPIGALYGLIGALLISIAIMGIWLYCKFGDKCRNRLRAKAEPIDCLPKLPVSCGIDGFWKTR